LAAGQGSGAAAEFADALRQLAKAERIPVVLLSQLRRPQNVNDAPTMIDLKESGDIEAHAHVVLLLHVPTAADGKPMGEDTVIVAKNRNGAKGPIVRLLRGNVRCMDSVLKVGRSNNRGRGTSLSY
jgi:replicative DNA helicase